MNVKQEHLIFGLIGVGAAIVLYLLYVESQSGGASSAAAAEAPIPGGSSVQSYPNPNPIQLGDVTINETTPGYMTGNRTGREFNPVKVTGKGAGLDHCGCEDNDCDAAGVPVTEQKIEQSVLDAAENNLNSFIRKNGSAGWA